MNDAITKQTTITVGLDVGDRYVQVCVLDEAGEVVEESRVPTKPAALERCFAAGDQMRMVLSPILRTIAQLTLEIKALDEQIEKTAEERYPETRLLTQVPGVGTLTAQCFMLTIEDPARFSKARAVASYVGLRPRQADSGSISPQLRITTVRPVAPGRHGSVATTAVRVAQTRTEASKDLRSSCPR